VKESSEKKAARLEQIGISQQQRIEAEAPQEREASWKDWECFNSSGLKLRPLKKERLS